MKFKQYLTKDNINNGLLILAVLCFILLTQFYIHVDTREAWFDASFSLQTAHMLNEGQEIDFRYHDVHPPVSYGVLAVWQSIQPSWYTEQEWARTLSTVFGLIFILVMFAVLKLIWKDEDYSYAGLVTLLLSVSTIIIHYATEIRMYIMLICLAAIALWAIVRNRPIELMLPVFLLPLIHYVAAAASFYFVVMYVFVNWNEKHIFREASTPIIGAFLGLAATLVFAIPQRMRSTGTWFQNHNIFDLPSTLVYSYSANGTMEIGHTVATYLFHVAFLAAIVVSLWYAFSKYDFKNLNRTQRIEIGMFATALVPLAYLFLLSFGSGGFFNLYHHRFFLVLMWMFGAIVLKKCIEMIIYIEDFSKIGRYGVLILLIGLFVFPAVLQMAYSDTQHNELENIAYATPCPLQSEEAILIGHESPFSGLPYYVYERERDCNWDHFIWTSIDKGLANAGGYDAFHDSVYWNTTLPTAGFYYVQSTGEFFNLTGRNSTVVAEDEGIWLRYVYPKQSTVEITFS